MKRFLLSLVAMLAMCAPIAAPAASRFIITSSSAQTCTSVATTAQFLFGVINASSSAQSATLSLYDEAGASPSCASGDLIYSAVLGASQVVTFPILPIGAGRWLNYGLAYKLSAAASNNIILILW